ncbi:2-succinyl-6-hydroxy-2,4-cyclohexadiene-1-carboxylate synthase [Photobacterium kishitanii]|uniref:Putative 2-succinyl-6-hydroxy-2,4-cyclohexadiene-1-carboxylate synthase n=1 Tax=Photobacterium kishitanii TaxID=318456 RepID=A0A2T3KFZ8_9GAMM|nr:2-succinyl-6-hydroxy-2,4-cyclohexadiene-1-carboxylate synthase [Photobacterium kishitanii]OBU26644.1 2-succinyl-6-hydroxy-2,4-cyclohexadiene-1-carboxylate synthase [Photobacterium kishitanii]PSU92765.1 2-succinyl-6-hydroxy-2,4-cyclohexadiene-1-carboxylate synthase [Photobacterium kishitanii]PSU97679.1 2-succinyl-6-hydroxy-2,4-cyclohexadiene-1-carboxylate synthase [Photobacterium kishitanii]PSW70407.1 2-succinyl-6-hydroxy-2,4-cyclohexadiene-1-carboxylate synthase [Photobacterium kishitanii]
MLLYSETFGVKTSVSQPTLVFLHGLLGNGRDWRYVISQLAATQQCITIDLPGHGLSAFVNAEMTTEAIDGGFEAIHQALIATLKQRGVGDYVLIGYSMGARLAMYHACALANHSISSVNSPRLMKVLLEGGHFGLPVTERESRYQHDQRWAARFAQQPLVEVLQDWYQQPVFSSLTVAQQQALVVKRSDNLGSGIAQMMLATSLAKQPQLLPQLQQLSLPIHYLCGERDIKFCQLASACGLNVTVIDNAGHNIHIEQPIAFTTALLAFLDK